MTLCIPVTEENGTASRLSEHFGRAPFHLLIDPDSMETKLLSREAECGEGDHGHCLPVDTLLANGVDMVVCKGIGRGAVARFAANRIDVFAAQTDTVAEVLEEFRRLGTAGMGTPRVCEGHGDHHH